MSQVTNKCAYCAFGGKMERGNCRYSFKTVIKVNSKGEIITINYLDGDHGCRASSRNEDEKRCLKNNFSDFFVLTF